MRYQLKTEIDLPRERVIELFLDPDNLQKWQPDLISIEPLTDGDPRALGAKTRQIHRMGNQEVEMIETITANNYPDEFSAIYDGGGVWNHVENRFSESGDGRTHWVLDAECRASGLMWLMLKVMPGMFKKQTVTMMEQFKQYAERSAQD